MGVWGEASNKRGLIDCKRDNYWRMSKTHVYLCVFQVSSWWRHLWWCALFLFYCTCIHPLSVVLCMLASIFYNALLWSRRPGASRSAFIIWSLNFWKVAPCSVLVKKSVIMLSVGQYFMVTSFVAKQSVTKKYNAWTERCKTNEILGVFEDWDDVSKVCRSILRGGGGKLWWLSNFFQPIPVTYCRNTIIWRRKHFSSLHIFYFFVCVSVSSNANAASWRILTVLW